VCKGKPSFKSFKKLKLQYATNTDAQLFRMNEKKGKYYYLISGRWFSSENPEGPWVFATPDLPSDFQNIPIDHEKADIRASVPGTDEAAEAVLLASIPQTAKVNAKEMKAPDVTYEGEPDFKPIQGSTVLYAANSSYDVVRVENHYYLCYQAVWFASTSPKGPWTLCTSVPVEIANLPSDAPVQHLAYVTVVDPNPEEPVYAYTGGYVGMSIAFGCCMWGTGWYYPPYYHGGYYHPWPHSYGGGYGYNPRTGAYGRYATAYGPYGGVGAAASYNPRTGTYKRSAAAYGPGGSAYASRAYNPRTGTAAATRGGSNVYGSWGSSAVVRGDDWARTQRVTDANGNTRWKAQGSGGGSATGWRGPGGQGFVGEKNGDVYAGRNGEVYRKTDGGWQNYENGGWNDVGGSGNRPGNQPSAGTRPSQQPSAGTRPSQQPSAGTRPSTSQQDQLNRDARARQQGNQRTQSYQGSSSRGGYSGGSRGGGSRGGGGGRGGRR
jgi:hypothetical protein